MKASEVMTALGYGALHGNLIREERAREVVKEVTITQEDFDKALEQRWHTFTCLLAQTCIRLGLRRDNGDPHVGLLLKTPMGKKIAAIFDQEWCVMQRKDSPRMRWLREALPITIELR